MNYCILQQWWFSYILALLKQDSCLYKKCDPDFFHLLFSLKKIKFWTFFLKKHQWVFSLILSTSPQSHKCYFTCIVIRFWYVLIEHISNQIRVVWINMIFFFHDVWKVDQDLFGRKKSGFFSTANPFKSACILQAFRCKKFRDIGTLVFQKNILKFLRILIFLVVKLFLCDFLNWMYFWR